ncbi:MAG: hypothetical protein H6940_13490 [Burkholderiales bacterium]|uniref:hypothetical protein n=1 Tax=Nitrosomonas sp. TaxID=42353 RepID=UPI001D6CCB5B|nr:hypothetical protein [Nitrosomonas sp.]MCB1949840.1 hypothetical protein [Nitrosomonas sp.]MCP5244410.1 hypothetical protein [Burkholderiales bacterium]
MKVISPRLHGYLDFLTVFIFLIAPTLLGLSQLPAILAYTLAVVHLIVTLGSDFPFGMVKIIPFVIHGWIERIVGPLLIAMPFMLNFSNEEPAKNFYILMGIIVIIVGVLTNYQAETSDRKAIKNS